MFELPPWYVSRVSIKHGDAPWLWEMGIRWAALPIASDFELCVGGLTYTAVPFSSWCGPVATCPMSSNVLTHLVLWPAHFSTPWQDVPAGLLIASETLAST